MVEVDSTGCVVATVVGWVADDVVGLGGGTPG